ncbi:Neuronal growth regulator 1 [Tupaia chinensis]|uniref:Neuronal growth regulator 1 n=1 Tax=Tupaia chinensis TaxID=246437 RepID=L9LBJ7_TUPCH|nr:Neuronal growth regulator 1 [Tupaia chinensis]
MLTPAEIIASVRSAKGPCKHYGKRIRERGNDRTVWPLAPRSAAAQERVNTTTTTTHGRRRHDGADHNLEDFKLTGACCSNQWLAAVLLSLCCLLPSCLPAGQSVDFPWAAVDNMMVRKGDTAVLR